MATGGALSTSPGGSRPRRSGLPSLIAFATIGLIAAAFAPVGIVVAKDHDNGAGQVVVSPAVHSDVSGPLSNLAPAPVIAAKDKKEKKKYELPLAPASSGSDPVVQSSPGGTAAPATTTSFDGIGMGLGTYSPRWAPPDTEGAVGPNDYFEIVNADIAIFSKDGTLRYGPVPTNTLWSGFGGSCQDRDDGDGIVEYDRLADRWVVTQFANDGTNIECVAVSTSGDPLGSYARYSFTNPAFPDYPKLAVWPDAYYITFNLFGSSGFAGGQTCAYDRTKMLAGQPANQQCFNVGTSYGGLLPSDLDGNLPPPAGSPDFILNYGTNRLNLWRFHVDWANPANTTLSGPTAISVASFSAACGGGACIPQPNTTQKLDSLADRLMSRLAYRNFGDHESLVVNHSVGTGFLNRGPSGVRWYELRSPNGTPTVHQQGTYTPDSTYRWMGSIAMDKVGDIALGYSASSSSISPSIRYTGHLVTDANGLMTQGEGTLQAGTGSQLASLSRWGDYTSMTVDPTDDCTFWYVGEYLKANGTWNWSTRIGSFSLPGCLTSTSPTKLTITKSIVNTGGGTAAATAWTLSATGPTTISGATGDAAITNAVVSPGMYTLAESGGPSGYGASAWSCTGVTPNGNSITLAAGVTASCSITNTFIQPVTVPSAPQNLTAVRAPAGSKGVQLSWSAPASTGGASSVTYNIYRGTTAGGESGTAIRTGLSSTSFLDNPSPRLVSGQRYYYEVVAVNSAGNGPPSNEASAKAR